jgi:hypothetical protein
MAYAVVLAGSRAAFRRLIAHQAAYAEHPDAAAAAAGTIALVLAWDSPFYPLSVLLLVGGELWWSLLTMLIAPVFYAIPWLMRKSARAGRVALPVVGALNTVWCIKLFGPGSGVGVFLFPCIMLAALLFRPGERWLMLFVMAVALALEFLPTSLYGAPIMTLSADESATLSGLNAGSVALLTALIVFQFVGVMRAERPVS